MTDAEPRTTTGGGGLLGAFDGAMAGITEADVAAALDAPGSRLAEPSPTPRTATASPAAPGGPAAGVPVPDQPEPVTHPIVDPRAQAVADRLLGRAPSRVETGAEVGSDDQTCPAPQSARLVAAEGGAVAECGPGCAILIGRADGDLVVPLGVVSRRHCQVDRIGDRYVVADLGSANGTLVCRPDGTTIGVIADPVELHPGDVIATARGRRPIARLEPARSTP